VWRSRFLLYAVAAAAAAFVVPPAAHAAGPPATMDEVRWQLVRASGLAAYVLLSASVFLGLAVRTRALDTLMRRAWTYEAHQFLSILAAVFTGLHVALLLGNRHAPFDLVDVTLPLVSGWRPVPVALGIAAAYLTLAVLFSSYLRGRLGFRAWRLLHYGSFGAWALAWLHGLTAGSDTGLAWVQYVYLAAGGAVGFLVVFRLLMPANRPARPAAVPGGRGRAPRP
jgi:predicted ferric reductase